MMKPNVIVVKYLNYLYFDEYDSDSFTGDENFLTEISETQNEVTFTHFTFLGNQANFDKHVLNNCSIAHCLWS